MPGLTPPLICKRNQKVTCFGRLRVGFTPTRWQRPGGVHVATWRRPAASGAIWREQPRVQGTEIAARAHIAGTIA